jgi:hypothetical protein
LNLKSEKLVSSLCFLMQLVPLHEGGGETVDVAAAAAEKAALREPLAEALAPAAASLDRSFSRRGRARSHPAAAEGVMLCWGLLLRYTMRLSPDSPTRERLLDYARVTKVGVGSAYSRKRYVRLTPCRSRRL